jgi:hypothetical protein
LTCQRLVLSLCYICNGTLVFTLQCHGLCNRSMESPCAASLSLPISPNHMLFNHMNPALCPHRPHVVSCFILCSCQADYINNGLPRSTTAYVADTFFQLNLLPCLMHVCSLSVLELDSSTSGLITLEILF